MAHEFGHNPEAALAQADSWAELRSLTSARIALGRSGSSQPTRSMLDFQLAHAQARDAVHAVFDPQRLQHEIENLKSEISDLRFEVRSVNSAAADAQAFLLRPDLGRRVNDQGRVEMEALGASANDKKRDLVIVASDGLSAQAVHKQCVPLLRELLSRLAKDRCEMSPIVICSRGRVAIEDEIGEVLRAEIALILIGERPGLGSPDSLGAYLVYGPRAGKTDADRNCVSNIRPEGLGYEPAARTIHYLLTQARQHKLSGVGLKDNSRLLISASPEIEKRPPNLKEG